VSLAVAETCSAEAGSLASDESRVKIWSPVLDAVPSVVAGALVPDVFRGATDVLETTVVPAYAAIVAGRSVLFAFVNCLAADVPPLVAAAAAALEVAGVVVVTADVTITVAVSYNALSTALDPLSSTVGLAVPSVTDDALPPDIEATAAEMERRPTVAAGVELRAANPESIDGEEVSPAEIPKKVTRRVPAACVVEAVAQVLLEFTNLSVTWAAASARSCKSGLKKRTGKTETTMRSTEVAASVLARYTSL